MDEFLSEKEQIDQMRDWWRDNGTYVIAGLVLGIGGVFGFNAWKDSQESVRVDASTRFEDLADEVAENRLENAELVADDLYGEFTDTIYADQARLAMARLYMDQGRDQDAAETLEAQLSAGNSDELKMVARLRLAKVYLYQNKPQEVLDLLAGFEESGFGARYSEAIGDAHFALGEYEAAEAAWQQALIKDDSNQVIDTTLVQMKIGDLPSGEVASPDSAATVPGLDEPAAADDEQSDAGATEGEAGSGEPPAADETESDGSAEAEEPLE